MVKIRESEIQPQAENDGNYVSWRYSHRPRTVQREPKGLLELEILVKKQILLMRKYYRTYRRDEVRVMDLLRTQYNLSFIVLCENCGGTHDHDELLAPER